MEEPKTYMDDGSGKLHDRYKPNLGDYDGMGVEVDVMLHIDPLKCKNKADVMAALEKEIMRVYVAGGISVEKAAKMMDTTAYNMIKKMVTEAGGEAIGQDESHGMKRKVIHIKTCSECPYGKRSNGAWHCEADHPWRTIHTHDDPEVEIPDWCPLESD